MISKDTHNATFSPESAGGAMPCGSPDGMMRDLFGQEVVPVSLSAAKAAGKGNKMSGTYGRIGIGSFESQRLQLSLESRLMMQLPLDGWMKSCSTWKRFRTPALRWICRLVPPPLRILEKEYGFCVGTPLAHGRQRSKKRNVGRIPGPIELAIQITGGQERDISPRFPCWIMGYPPEWDDCAVMATPLSRKSRGNSSKPLWIADK